MSINITWPTNQGSKQAVIPLPFQGIGQLKDAIKSAFGTELSSKNFTLTDTLRDITNDNDVKTLKNGSTIVIAHQKGALAAPAREKISFQPHPKTLTMAGDYEYFAAQGRHPFVYALAEFIDNSLRATRANAPRPREIMISLLTSGSGSAKKGIVCIQDNGCGMTKHELNDWAIMNYSMEERGTGLKEPELDERGKNAPAAGRFLTGDLSFFGVGSKNAAFFMGSSVKITTRKSGERYVHELFLAASDLEERYRNQQAVYEEDMVHRNPGDESTLSKIELPFVASKTWVKDEEKSPGEGFTRVVIGDLKPDVLQQLADDAGGAQICRELAHLYHYYLHGESGNRTLASPGTKKTTLPNGEPLPNITLRHASDTRVLWECRLADVDDDLETRMLRAHKSEFTFSLQVPDRGTINGVIYYFPYENNQETVPTEALAPWAAHLPPPPVRTQQVGLASQYVGGTQLPGRGTAADGGHKNSNTSQDDFSDDENNAAQGVGSWRMPILKAFWQGRLIPSAQVDSLPFIEAVRLKRSAATKDTLPDEVFGRLKGALFFGPAFKVTRNKLLFRDNLPELLSAAIATDRNIERHFKDWLTKCHATLDKSYRFEKLAESRQQASLRSRVGESITAFERISDGTRVFNTGDVVRVSAKPSLVGRIVYFTVPMPVREEGSYANGRVHIEPLPKEVHGTGPPKDFSLRRLEALLDDKEVKEHCAKEMTKLPTALRLEPMKYATSEIVELTAGETIPETSVAVLNIAGQKITRSFFNGQKQSLSVQQRLWWLPHANAKIPGAENTETEPQQAGTEEEEEERPAKRIRRPKKSKKQNQEEEEEEEAGVTEPTAVAELLVDTGNNSTPYKDIFAFHKIHDGLKRVGNYVLEYILTPAVGSNPPLRRCVSIKVNPGAPTALKAAGEGVAAIADHEFVLGESIPPLKLLLADEYGNDVALTTEQEAAIKVQAMIPSGSNADTLEKCRGITTSGNAEKLEKCVILRDLSFIGSKKALAAACGLQLFAKQEAGSLPTSAHVQAAQHDASQTLIHSVPIQACFSLMNFTVEPEYLTVQLRPGAPRALKLVPTGSGWETPTTSVPVQSGAEIPEFTVKAFDAWGNLTAPAGKLDFSLVVTSDAIVDSPHSFAFDSNGLATASGMFAAMRRSGPASIAVSVVCKANGSVGMQAAIDVAQPAEEMRLAMEILPSALPTFAQITVNGEPVPMEDRPDDDGEGTVPTAVLHNVEAGSQRNGLRLMLLDESGAPAAVSISGRVMVSWHSGSKKITWKGEPIKLPGIRIPDSTAETVDAFVRFVGDGANPLVIECRVHIAPVPGPPSSWAVSLVDQVNGQSPEQHGFVVCGRPFVLEIEALDRLNNRCKGGASALPMPKVTIESEGPLEYNPEEWESEWVMQGQDEVYTVRMAVSGHPGEIKLKVKDSGAEDGTSLLGEDCLSIDLRPGPPAALAFEGPASLECGTKAALGNVEVVLRDASGYPTKSTETFEITLVGSALATDGSGRAAKVVANGGNKAKMTKNKTSAVFKGLVVTAEEPGTYAMRVQSSSRKVALQEGVLQLVMTPLAAAKELQVCVPVDVATSYVVGQSNKIFVSVVTENNAPLPEDAILSGLTLKITPPGGSRGDVITCSFATPEDGEGGLVIESGSYAFSLPPELTQSGTWTAIAEYTESRVQVRAALGKAAQIRSAAVQFTMLPGLPVNATVEAPQLPDKVAVTNAAASKSRLIVRNMVAQIQDSHGNAAHAEGVKVRFRLDWAHGGAAPADGALLPILEGEDGLGPKEVDQRGRAYFGKLSIAEASGAAPAGPIECVLLCEAYGLYPAADFDMEMDDEGWAVCWKCQVFFSDNTTQFAEVDRLHEQRTALLERKEAIEHRIHLALKSMSLAEKQEKRAISAAETLKKRVATDLPTSLKSAERQLRKLEAGDDGTAGGEVSGRQARWGPSKNPMTGAIDLVLRSNMQGVIGVFAQLVTVNDERLSTAASYALRGLLSTMVVEDTSTRSKIVSMLTEKKYPVPDVLPLTQVSSYRGPKQGDPPGLNTSSDLAQTLIRAACAGTDRPLPLPLPHQKSNNNKDLSSPEWPQGCLGYLCNLLRPVVSGHRATVIFSFAGMALVFTSLDDASTYREHVTQNLKLPFTSDIITLDGGRISGRGVIAGSNYRPTPLDKADFVIGSGEGSPGNGTEDEVEIIKSWIEILKDKELADSALAQATREVSSAEEQCQPELDSIEAELANLDAQIAHLQKSPGNGHTSSATKGKRKLNDPHIEAKEDEDHGKGSTKRRRV